MSDSLMIKKENDILEIMFNRPESRNAITRDMFEQMLTTLEKCKEDNELRAIFLSGKGESFSAGGDVTLAGVDGGNVWFDGVDGAYNAYAYVSHQ